MITPDGGPVQAAAPCQGFVSGLVLRCGAGEVAALGTLVDVFGGIVAQRVGEGQPRVPVEDAACAAFVRLWERAPSFRPGRQNGVEWVLDQVAAFTAEQTAYAV